MDDQFKQDVDIPFYQKVLLTGAIGAIFLLACWVYVLVFGHSSNEDTAGACGASRFSYEASCPSPGDEYDPSKDVPTPGY